MIKRNYVLSHVQNSSATRNGATAHHKYRPKRGVLKWAMLFCIVMTGMVLLPNISFAAAFGIYADYGGGSGEVESDIMGADDFDIDTNQTGLGFQMETDPVNKDKVFSYRCQAGLEARELEDEEGVSFELGGIMLNNTFSFGGNISEKVRIWAGPQVLFGIYAGDTDEEYAGDDFSFTGVLFGLGIAGGANFALGDEKAILTTTIGWRSFGVAGVTEWYDEEEDMTGDGSEFYVSVGIMF